MHDELAPGNLEVSATAAERGSSQSHVPAAIDGPEGEIAFNSRYLTDVLSILRTGRVMIGMNGAEPGRRGEAARVGDLHVRHHAHGHRRPLTLFRQ